MMFVVFAILIAMGFAVLVLILSSIMVSIVAGKLKGKPEIIFGVLMQISIIVFTLLIVFLVIKNPTILGTLLLPLISSAEGIMLAGLVSLLTCFLEARITKKCKPPIELRSIWEFMILAFIVAPIGEELLFRGLVEGYLLLSRVGLATSVIVPAVMFSLIHILPYRNSPRPCLILVLTSSFAIRLIAGFFRANTDSIILPIIIHLVGNISGFKYYPLNR